MHIRYRTMLLIVTGLLLIAGTALAQKPSVTYTPLSGDEAIDEIRIGTPLSSNVACNLGITGPPFWLVDYFLPPSDAYYTYLAGPPNCTQCTGPGGVLLSTAHVLLNFREDCVMEVTVAIVGATGAAGCRQPSPTNVLCPQAAFVIDPPSPGNFDVAFALPAACCITTDAFLEFTVNYIGCADATYPRLITTDGCVPCLSWNIYPGGTDELCADAGFPGNPNHYVNADCCTITPTKSGTWGRLKTLHR